VKGFSQRRKTRKEEQELFLLEENLLELLMLGVLCAFARNLFLSYQSRYFVKKPACVQ
jgi:hypothetical protein